MTAAKYLPIWIKEFGLDANNLTMLDVMQFAEDYANVGKELKE